MTILTSEAKLEFEQRKRAYQLAFGSPAGTTVLADFSRFCRARETCVVPGDRDQTFILEGRREVFLRVQDYLDLSIEQLIEKYTRPAEGAISHD